MKKLIVFLAALLIAPFSFGYEYSGLSQINNIIRGTAGLSQAVGTGAVVTAAGDVLVAPSGLSVPVSVAAEVSSGALATAASAAVALCLNPIGLVACPVATAAAVGAALKAAGVGYGPCPAGSEYPYAFICHPAPAPSPSHTYYVTCQAGALSGGSIDDLAAQCKTALESYWHANGYGSCVYGAPVIGASSFSLPYAGVPCGNYPNIGYTSGASTCPTGYSLSNGVCVADSGPPMVPPSQTEVHDDLMNDLSHDSVMNKILYDALKHDQAAAPGDWPDTYNPVTPTTPVTVTAPPVTSPETTVKVETIPQADGSTDTKTTTQHTTVTPTTTGTTISDSKTTFPSQTVTTVTTVNNVSNVTTTNTTTTNNNDKPQDPTDQCKLHPDAVGCQVLGTPPDIEDIPKQEIPLSFSSVPFVSASGCPAPITYDLGKFGGAKSISFQPFCDWASSVRSIFLALGALTAAIVMIMGLKNL